MTRRACVFLTIACTGAQMLKAVEARWHPGQSWLIEYLRPAPSPAGHPSGSAATMERSVWRYRVMDAEGGQQRIEAVEEGGDGRFELWFSAAPSIFRRAVQIAGERRIDTVIHSGATPYFGWS